MKNADVEWLTAPLVGALPAGAVFIATIFALNANFADPAPITLDYFVETLVMGCGILLGGTFFGWFIAIVPTLIGTWTMAQLGRRFELARLHIVWAAVGALIVTIAAVVGHYLIEEVVPQYTAPFILAAMACAWASRRKVRWLDDQPTEMVEVPHALPKADPDPRLLH